MTKWEYITVIMPNGYDKWGELPQGWSSIFNKWGKDGWELIQVDPFGTIGILAFFKRPLPPTQ